MDRTEENATAALEKAVSARKAQVERAQRHVKEQLAKARRSGVAAGSSETRAEIARMAQGPDERALTSCFWFAGFVPGFVVNGLCAVLALALFNRAIDTPKLSFEGEPAAFFIAAILLPLLLSVALLVVLLGKSVRSAGARGYWRTVGGYALGTFFAAALLALRLLLAHERIRLILYRC